MGRNKRKRFAENADNPHVIGPGKAFYEANSGRWQSEFFQNDHPIHLELACGRGEYSLNMGRLFPYQNFIGVDIKGDRIWKGATAARKEGLTNVAFLRCRMHELGQHFAENEADSIRIIFPDPRPKKSDARRRLTFPRYLRIYRQILKAEGWFRLKTDSDLLFDYTLEQLANFPIRDLAFTPNLYRSPLLSEHYGIRTRYEKMWLEEGRTIKYLKCRFLPND